MIAAVNGPAYVHAEIAELCDLLIAADAASFQDAPHLPNGIVPRARVTMLNDADADKAMRIL